MSINVLCVQFFILYIIFANELKYLHPYSTITIVWLAP